MGWWWPLGAAVESRRAFSEASARRIQRGVGAIAIATLVAVLAGGLVAAGNPVSRVRHGWDTFKAGYVANNSSASRLTSGLGSNRYDFYRVGLNEFVAHPLLGIGADNFQQQYLAHGRSEETPHYPHSVELRTLVETGLVGAVLALVGLGAALTAGGRALRYRGGRLADPLARDVAAAALAGFAYWVVHGSFDWFWEFAGLGAPAFALLGLACALEPARPRRLAEPAGGRSGAAGAGAAAEFPGTAGRAAGSSLPEASACSPVLSLALAAAAVAGCTLVEPAAGPERGAHMAGRAAEGVLPPGTMRRG